MIKNKLINEIILHINYEFPDCYNEQKSPEKKRAIKTRGRLITEKSFSQLSDCFHQHLIESNSLPKHLCLLTIIWQSVALAYRIRLLMETQN